MRIAFTTGRHLIRLLALLTVCFGTADLGAQNGEIRLTAATPLRLVPDARREPLTVIPAGGLVRVQGVEGEWIRVVFRDSSLGDRHGFIPLSAVASRRDRSEAQPPPATPDAAVRRSPAQKPLPLPTQPAPRATSVGPAEVFASAKDSVVTVRTSTGQGSGVVVGPAGAIVTNLHVIAGATKAAVALADGESFEVESVLALDREHDLALLRIKGSDLRVIPLGDSDSLVVGERVMAIGSPSGLELSLSDGIVSAVRDLGDGYKVVQTTAAISPGSSGGGLFNTRGELVGITTFKLRDAENLNFAIPANDVRRLLNMPASALSFAEANDRLGIKDQAGSRPTQGTDSRSTSVPQLEVKYQHTLGPTLLVRLFEEHRGEAHLGGRPMVSEVGDGFNRGGAW